jgi:uncharacterized protein
LSFYLDTSVIVALFAKEETVAGILALLNQAANGQPVISDWNVTEFSAAISFKLNIGTLNAVERFEALNDFHNASATLFKIIPVITEDFNRAANFANQSELRLRGGDALHLSIAAGHRLPILTLDKRMIAAANTLGIGVVELP